MSRWVCYYTCVELSLYIVLCIPPGLHGFTGKVYACTASIYTYMTYVTTYTYIVVTYIFKVLYITAALLMTVYNVMWFISGYFVYTGITRIPMLNKAILHRT